MNSNCVVLGVVALLSCSCGRLMEDSQPACGNGFPRVVYSYPSAGSVLEVPGPEMRKVVRYEPPMLPDRRFVIAVAELEELITASPILKIQVDWDGSGWLLRHEAGVLGRLPSVPDFSDAFTLLESRARRGLEGTAPARLPEAEIDEIESRLQRFRPPEIIEALRRTDGHWRAGWRDPRMIVLAARGLVLLDLQGLHEVEITDGLGGKAMATLALASTIGDADLRAEEALLANRFGYSAQAVEVARSLPVDSPVRAYLLYETDDLRKLAEDTHATPLTRYLYLSRLAEQRDTGAWQSWIARYVREPRITTSVLSTGFLAGRHEITRPLTPVHPYLALLEFWASTGNHPDIEAVREFNGQHERELLEAILAIQREVGETTAGLIGRFEEDAEQIERDFPGPFLDSGVARGYYGGHLYGSIVHLARYDLDILASLDLSMELLEGMEGAPPPVGDQIERWYRDLVQSETGHGDVQELAHDLERVGCLGDRSWMRSFEELQQQLPYADPRVQNAAGSLARRLDSRPAHQFQRARLATARFDLSGRDELYRNLVNLAAPAYRGTQSWLAHARGDTTNLRAMIEDPELDIRWRVDALEYLVGDDSVGDAYLRQIAAPLIASNPDRWEIREAYLKHLEKMGAYEEGIALVWEWKFDNRERDAFESVIAQTALARLYFKQGQYRRAESAIENVIRMNHAGTLGRAALIFQRVGREEEALEIAQWGIERYPDFAFSRVVLAEVLWRQGRFRDVPEILYDSHHPLDVWAWREDVAEAFLRVFADAPTKDAEDAFREIVRAGVPSWISEALPQGLNRRKRPDLAFVLQAQLQATDAIGSYRNPIRAYLYLKAWRGEDVALNWIRPLIPHRVFSQVSRVMYTEGADELLWELIPDPEATTYPDVLWLTRAASAVRENAEVHLPELRTHYTTARASDFDVMGRYLLGLDNEKVVLELARTPDRRAQIAYYVGLKAQSEGRVRDALDWYRVVLATGEDKKYEYSFAFGALEAWKNSDWTVDRIEGGGVTR